MNEIAAKIIAREEGFKPYCYLDHLGYQTIGHGILIDKRKGGGITLDESEMILHNRIGKIEAQLEKNLPWMVGLDEVRRAVLVSMAYQMGVFGLLGFHATLAAIREQRWDDARDLMLQSKWAKQTPARAERHANAIKTGIFA